MNKSGMKFFLRVYRLAILLAGLMLFTRPQAQAQTLQMTVTTDASALLVSNNLTYNFNLTNLTGLPLINTLVTNILPTSVQIVGYTASQGVASNYSGVIQFYLGTFDKGSIAQLSLTVQPTNAGPLTNFVRLTTLTLTNTVLTNVVVQVTNAPLPSADFAVGITGPPQVVITNDWITYRVSVTNAGPSAAVFNLTNTLPAGVGLLGISPTNLSPSIFASNILFTLGPLAAGGFTNLQFTVQPTNAGILNFSAAVGGVGVLDANLTNNYTATNLLVTNYFAGTLVAVTNSGQTVNPQNGLTEQSVWITNPGPAAVSAVRLVVTGITNQLFNAVGTNNGNPFVYFSAPLAAGQSAGLLLQYLPRIIFPFTNGQLHAFPVPLPNWTPPPATTVRTNINLSRIVKLASGNLLLEFPATNGATYTVVYSDNVLFSNAQIAPPAILAPANRVQWIDYGPPTTRTAPTNAARFYRVFQNP